MSTTPRARDRLTPLSSATRGTVALNRRPVQMVGLVTGLERVGGIGPQMYHAYPGCMEVREAACEDECEYQALTASAADLRAGLVG
jgi:hypothetical protein